MQGYWPHACADLSSAAVAPVLAPARQVKCHRACYGCTSLVALTGMGHPSAAIHSTTSTPHSQAVMAPASQGQPSLLRHLSKASSPLAAAVVHRELSA